MMQTLFIGVAVLACLTPTLAQAQSGEPLSQQRAGAYLAGTCANCHGTAGKSNGGLPTLAGLPKDTLIQSMRDFREGKRPATVMHQLAKGYSDEQVALMAEYFAQQVNK
jgi:cytochrome subunit of sulfide dehydrogenase